MNRPCLNSRPILLGVWIALWLVFNPATAGNLMSVEQAQKRLFPELVEFTPVALKFDSATKKALKKRARVRIKPALMKAWRVHQNGQPDSWFFVDQVIGKHELITYALAVSADGAVRGIEILDYLETHGGEVQQKPWRDQFIGKRETTDPIRLGKDIDGLSGATLSARNVTDGIRKLLIIQQHLANTSQ